MARPKLRLVSQVPHKTSIAKVERRQYEESLIHSDGEDLDTVNDVQFANETAKKEYFRALKYLREELSIVGNLNKSDLLVYANSYAVYMDCLKQYRKRGFKLTVETTSGIKPNPICKMMDDARRTMVAAERCLGMTIDGQLSAAKAKADKEEADMEAQFGAI